MLLNKYLYKAYCVRISEVVLDFIQDMEGKIWLIGMKSLKLEEALSMQEISGVYYFRKYYFFKKKYLFNIDRRR